MPNSTKKLVGETQPNLTSHWPI